MPGCNLRCCVGQRVKLLLFIVSMVQLGLAVTVILLVRYQLYGSVADSPDSTCLLAPADTWPEACTYADVVASISMLFTFLLSLLQMYQTSRDMGGGASSVRQHRLDGGTKRCCGGQAVTMTQLVLTGLACLWWAAAAAALTHASTAADAASMPRRDARAAVAGCCWGSLVLFGTLLGIQLSQLLVPGCGNREGSPTPGAAAAAAAADGEVANGRHNSATGGMLQPPFSYPSQPRDMLLRTSRVALVPAAVAAAIGGHQAGVAIGVPVVPASAAAAAGDGDVQGRQPSPPRSTSISSSSFSSRPLGALVSQPVIGRPAPLVQQPVPAGFSWPAAAPAPASSTPDASTSSFSLGGVGPQPVSSSSFTGGGGVAQQPNSSSSANFMRFPRATVQFAVLDRPSPPSSTRTHAAGGRGSVRVGDSVGGDGGVYVASNGSPAPRTTNSSNSRGRSNSYPHHSRSSSTGTARFPAAGGGTAGIRAAAAADDASMVSLPLQGQQQLSLTASSQVRQSGSSSSFALTSSMSAPVVVQDQQQQQQPGAVVPVVASVSAPAATRPAAMEQQQQGPGPCSSAAAAAAAAAAAGTSAAGAEPQPAASASASAASSGGGQQAVQQAGACSAVAPAP